MCLARASSRSFATKRFTLASPAGKPWSSTRSCQIDIAVRPWPMPASIHSRYGSHVVAWPPPRKAMTLDRYSHLVPGLQKDATGRLEMAPVHWTPRHSRPRSRAILESQNNSTEVAPMRSCTFSRCSSASSISLSFSDKSLNSSSPARPEFR